MTKIRMNTEFRNKILNRYVDHAEKENTQEREAYLQSIEKVDELYQQAFRLATDVVSNAYPKEDVDLCKSLKQKYGRPLDVVAKDKCFYFSYAKDELEEDEDERDRNVSEHFDFGLFGSTGTSEYSDDTGKQFAYAYKREELKAKECNPDILAQQNGKDDNPHKTKHIDANNKFLGKSNSSYDDDGNIGMTKTFNEPFHLDVIGTSHCRSRAIACTKDEYNIFLVWRSAKANVVSKHQTWIDSLQKQFDQLKIGLKAYRYLNEGIELASELGIHVDEAELIRTNSTGLTIYNPSNLASMIKGMKNKNQTREDKIKARLQYEKQAVN